MASVVMPNIKELIGEAQVEAVRCVCPSLPTPLLLLHSQSRVHQSAALRLSAGLCHQRACVALSINRRRQLHLLGGGGLGGGVGVVQLLGFEEYFNEFKILGVSGSA